MTAFEKLDKALQDVRQTLIRELTDIQNRPENANRDILTITGLMTLGELSAHIARYK